MKIKDEVMKYLLNKDFSKPSILTKAFLNRFDLLLMVTQKKVKR